MKVPTDDPYDLPRIIAVCGGIAAGKIGEILGQRELLPHHDQCAFFALRLGPEVLGTKHQAKLKRHIEAREIVDAQLDA